MRCGSYTCRHTGVYTNWSLENSGLDPSDLMRKVTDVLLVNTGPHGLGEAGVVVMIAAGFSFALHHSLTGSPPGPLIPTTSRVL